MKRKKKNIIVMMIRQRRKAMRKVGKHSYDKGGGK